MKYKLTKEKKIVSGRLVYRIEALKDFDTIIDRPVKKGDKGGWVESEANLSQEGNCWLFDDACGYENSRRTENSVGYDRSLQFGDSVQSGNSKQSGSSQQSGNSRQSGNSKQYGNSCQSGDNCQYGNERIFRICGDDYLVIPNCGDENRAITVQDKYNYVAAGCFQGTYKEFKKAVIKKYGKKFGSYKRAIDIIERLRK